MLGLCALQGLVATPDHRAAYLGTGVATPDHQFLPLDRVDFPIPIIRRSRPPRASTASSASFFPFSCCSWRLGCASGSGKQRHL
eukprot:scaffold11028_cov57-Phaeocystis_antarctica.AAC.4